MQVFYMEMRKLIAYRADFWVNFIGRTFFSLVISYYLWASVYEVRGVNELNGFTLNKMILYYLVVPLMFRIQQGETIGSISREIYDGGLNKYILYPLNYYTYKITTHLANSSFYFLQLIFLLLVYNIFVHDPKVYQFDILNSFLFVIVLILASITYFALNSISEMIAFWADNIWSLGVIVRFLALFLGGGMIPLTFFPDWVQSILSYTPFPYLIHFPMQILFGEIQLQTFVFNSFILIFWFLFFLFLSNHLWQKGKFKYTGVGI